jgi:sigma-B regulation protein RsbU (phosphoserine phosphatase)
MLTAMTRSFISSASWRFDNLANFLREVNNNLFADTEADRFVSLGCCLLDKRNGILEFGRAGHTDLITFVNNHIRRFNPDGSALGLMPGELAEYDTICLKCSPHSSYLLYSDGINEALNKEGEEFGIIRLIKEYDASRKAGHSPQETLEHILHQVESFAPEQIDDQTLILVTFEGGNEVIS